MSLAGCWYAKRGVPVPAALAGDAERDELAHAVLDVEAHAPERLHQRLDLEGLLGPRAQEPQEPRAQRRLDERLEARLDLGRLGAPRGHRHVLASLMTDGGPRRRRGAPLRACGNAPTGTAR